MALDFSFKSQFPVAQMVQMIQQKNLQAQQMAMNEEQMRQQRMTTLLNNLSSVAQLGRTMQGFQADTLANQQTQSQMEGNKTFADLMNNQNKPMIGPMPQQSLVPGVQGPINPNMPQTRPSMGEQPGYDDQIRAALMMGNPVVVANQAAKKYFEDPEAQQTQLLKNIMLSTNISQAPEKLANQTKTADALVGRSGAIEKMANTRQAGYETSGLEPALKQEESRVTQATHLLNMLDQSYDPNTGKMNVKKLMDPEFNFGLARLVNPSAVAGIQTAEEFKQRTLQMDAAQLYQYVTGDSSSNLSNVMPEDIARLYAKSIDRQALQAEQNRDYYIQQKQEAIGSPIPKGLSYTEARKKSKIFGSKKPSFNGRLDIDALGNALKLPKKK